MATEVFVRHDIQVGHRLINLPGKCQQIHGHTMVITMDLQGSTNSDGYLTNARGEVLDFSAVKKVFRNYLDTNYDHHLLLNDLDPLEGLDLPGAIKVPGDPCVENIAKWIYEAMRREGFPVSRIQVDETNTNGVTYDGNY